MKEYNIEYFDEILDVKELIDPLPAYRSNKILRGLENGKILKIIAAYAGSFSDIPELAKKTGNVLLDRSKKDSEYIFRIRKENNKTVI